ncbi:hypothetical protein [Ulvibacterium sp.]|uniref:antibiotic biosynthesis monooxygenase family protein n=1 Tax=Ulvibacterium sp. TaxID=2665914 RepID=UPI00262DA7C8|nr:hypothetical protein [Ulvibacterium sp.]
MILEVTILNIGQGLSKEFEQSLAQATSTITKTKGYGAHELGRCIETKDQYISLMNCDTLENKEFDFQQSPDYHNGKNALRRSYKFFPEVLYH